MVGPYRGDQAFALRRKAELDIPDPPPAPPEWQDVAPGLDRIRAPGGWLYRAYNHGDSAVALCFVPAEPGGGWW